MILRAEGVRKRFETRWVLREASLALAPGEVLHLAGKNGSGKTTFARILATLLEPDGGSVFFDGAPIAKARREARRRIGFATHRPLLYLGLTPIENLTLFARLAANAEPARRAAELLDRFQMTAFERTPIERFSRGMVQRIALARAFLGAPRLLILDEPYAGLDDEGTAALNALLEAARDDGAAAIVITHDRERLGRLATRFGRLVDGRIEA